MQNGLVKNVIVVQDVRKRKVDYTIDESTLEERIHKLGLHQSDSKDILPLKQWSSKFRNHLLSTIPERIVITEPHVMKPICVFFFLQRKGLSNAWEQGG